SVAGLALRRLEPIVLHGRAEAEPVDSSYPQDLPSALVLPLRVGERSLGVLNVSLGMGDHAVADRALELLRLLANQAAILIEERRLVGELRRVVDELRRKEERLEQFVDRLLRAREARSNDPWSREPLPSAPSVGQARYEQITPREREVLRLLAEGLTNREIGERLFLSPDTVKDYVREIIGKLGAADRTQAAVIAIRAGLV